MLSHRPTPMALPLSPGRRGLRMLGVALALLVYGLIYAGLRAWFGPASGALASLAALLAGWFLGARLGLVIGLGAAWCNAIIILWMHGVDEQPLPARLFVVAVAGAVGWVVGRFHDTRADLARQLEDRQRLARELTRARSELETKVEERTRALAHANAALKAEMAERQEAQEAQAMLTDQRFALEQQLLRAQKMEAMGRLAGGVAHDFNNLLTAILGFADLATHQTGGEQLSAIAQIGAAAERASELTRALLAFARQQPLTEGVVDVNQVVFGAERLLERLIGEDIELSLSLSDEPWLVGLTRAHLEQVVVNLAVNARDAMPSGGTISIRTDNVQGPDGEFVRITVTDTGVGMDEATKARLFEPFFTTKEPGQGTGLGLATSYGIVTQADGHFHVTSEPGMGTSFTVELPRAEAGAQKVTPSTISRTVFRGRERVLLVEDEPLVRAIMEITLADQGYEVVTAETPAKAIEAARALRKFDVVVTDVILPGQNGYDLVQTLQALVPELSVLYVSGYAPEALRARGIPMADAALLEKPFAPVTLIERLQRVLSRRPVAKTRGVA